MTDADTPMPLLQCSWKLDDYLIYVSFATSTFSVINVIVQQTIARIDEGFCPFTTTAGKFFFGFLGFINGSYGLVLGMYLIYIKSITISLHLFPLFLFCMARICPPEIALRLWKKLFPKLSEFHPLSRTILFLSIVSPFWFLNLLKGAEFFTTTAMDAQFQASLRNSFPTKTTHPSVLLRIPCIYGKTPSLSRCLEIDPMLNEEGWLAMADTLYPNLYEPMGPVIEDETRFLEFASTVRNDIKGFRILVGNFSFLQPYSTHENALIFVDTVLLGLFYYIYLRKTVKNANLRKVSLMGLGLEVVARFTVIFFAKVDDGFLLSLLGLWASLSISTSVLTMLHSVVGSFCGTRTGRAIVVASFTILLLLPPLKMIGRVCGLSKKEMSSWKAMNDYCLSVQDNRNTMLDFRNVINEINHLKQETIQFYHTRTGAECINKTELLSLVKKNDFEYEFVKALNQNILYRVWFPMIFSASFLPFITFMILVMPRPKIPIHGCHWFQKIVRLFFIYATIPIMLMIGLLFHLTPIFQIDIYHEWAHGTNITTKELNIFGINYDRELDSGLLKLSKEWLDKIIHTADGLGGECYQHEFGMPKYFVFQLKSNIIHLSTKLMYKKFLTICLLPLLLHFHIAFCLGY